jgi:hypothetical protein
MARKKQSDTQTKKLFPDEQGDLFERSYQLSKALCGALLRNHRDTNKWLAHALKWLPADRKAEIKKKLEEKKAWTLTKNY